jgi:fluoride exporter
MTRLLCVCVGGAAGSGARFLLAEWIGGRVTSAFPWPILAVNVLGCLVVGFLAGFWASEPPSADLQALVATGFVGGFTTYSAFNHGVLFLVETGRAAVAAAYLATTVVGGLAAGLAGSALARLVR